MRTATWALLGTTVLATATIQLVPGAPSPAAAVDVPSLAVAGGARMYPAYSPATSRYAVHPAQDGSVRVEVTGAAEVWFDGVPDPDGAATYTDVVPGEEISVFVGSGSSRRTLALYVLPSGFPTLAAESTGAPLEPGNLALTLDNLTNGASPRFEAVVDRNGVPVYTRGQSIRALDLKLAANGHFTVHRPTTTPGRTGGALVELDDRFQELRRFETTGLVDTDDHDSRLMPDGSRWLIAYEPNAATGLVDSVIQHVGPDGELRWQWTSAPYADETMLPGKADYAHINSIDVQPDGAVLASFRNLSSVYLIRPGAGGGSGEVVWKLGGRDSDFSFPALPDGSADGGPCAQHSASLLPNGNVLVFDNGSHPFFGTPLCVDPQDPLGPTVERASTRVVELALSGGTATPVRTYGDTDRFAWFMGSAARMPGGGVLIGWSSAPDSIASETDAQGATLWRLRDTRVPVDGTTPKPYITYRVALVPARDGYDPEVVVDAPAEGVTVAQGADVPLAYSCTDRGGSTLQACDGPVGRRLDTAAPGTHTWTVAARDGSGRTTTRTGTYTVLADPRPSAPPAGPVVPPGPGPATPDLALRAPGARWIGAGTSYPAAQDLRARVLPGRALRATVRVTNAGASAGRFLLRSPSSGTRDLRIRWTHDGVRRTRALAGDGWRTPVVAPGGSLRLAVRIVVAPAADAGRRVVRIAADSSAGLRDRARLVVRIPRM